MTSPTSIRLPKDWLLPMLREVFVALVEVAVAHEASHGTQGAWVCALQDKVAALVDECCLPSCRSTPKHEDKIVAALVKSGDGGVSKCLPTLAAMAESLMLADGKAGVQEEHALLCPSCQVAALRDRCSRLGLYLTKNVLERRREGYAVVHAKAKSVCLPRAVIRVLPKDNDAHLVERRRVEGIEDEPPRRIASARSILLSHKLRQRLEVRLVEFLLQLCLPRRFYLYIHISLIIGQRYDFLLT